MTAYSKSHNGLECLVSRKKSLGGWHITKQVYYLCATKALIQEKNALRVEQPHVIPARKFTFGSSCAVCFLTCDSTLTRRKRSIPGQLWCFLPVAFAPTSDFMKFLEFLPAASYAHSSTWVILSDWAQSPPLLPASFCCWINHPGKRPGRRMIFTGTFHLPSTPHWSRLNSQASRRNEWETEEESFSVSSAKMPICTSDLDQCPQEGKATIPPLRPDQTLAKFFTFIPSPSPSFKSKEFPPQNSRRSRKAWVQESEKEKQTVRTDF